MCLWVTLDCGATQSPCVCISLGVRVSNVCVCVRACVYVYISVAVVSNLSLRKPVAKTAVQSAVGQVSVGDFGLWSDSEPLCTFSRLFVCVRACVRCEHISLFVVPPPPPPLPSSLSVVFCFPCRLV